MNGRVVSIIALAGLAVLGWSDASNAARATSHEVCDEQVGYGGRTRDGWDGDVDCVRSHMESGPDARAVLSTGAIAGGAAVGALALLLRGDRPKTA